MTAVIKAAHTAPVERRRPSLAPDTGLTKGTPRAVNVPLPGGQVAHVDLADFNALMEAGWSDQWFLVPSGRGKAYVRTTRVGNPKRSYIVARLVMSECGTARIRYADQDPLNLRRANLLGAAP